MKQKFTIEDLAAGRCAVKNDGTLGQLQEVLRKAFPNDNATISGDSKVYIECNKGREWFGGSNTILPIQSVTNFLTPAEPEFKNGDEVEVSDDGVLWSMSTFVGNLPSSTRFVVYSGGGISTWKYCRHPRQKVTYTKQQVAEALGVDLETLVITD